jgi:hypothetical protein
MVATSSSVNRSYTRTAGRSSGTRGSSSKRVWACRFAPKSPPGSAAFSMIDDMSPDEFREALDRDSNNVAAKVQMHSHTSTCTKYQRKDAKSRLAAQQRVPSAGVPTDGQGVIGSVNGTQSPPGSQQLYSQFRTKELLHVCRFLFPRPLVPRSHVTIEGFIRMQRNHQYVNKYNPVISSAIRCNHDVNFTPSSPKVLAAIYYMTNWPLSENKGMTFGFVDRNDGLLIIV